MEVLFSHGSMDDLGQATEDQVILAWLQAEIESPEFQAYLVGNPPNPANLSLALKAARSPDLRDQTQNDLRRQIITATYGFGKCRGSYRGLGCTRGRAGPAAPLERLTRRRADCAAAPRVTIRTGDPTTRTHEAR